MMASRASIRGFSVTELLVVLAVGSVLMAIGTPILRGALLEQRLRAGASDVSRALAEARREAFRTSETARVEVNPAARSISVFARDTAANTWVERRLFHLPPGIQFVGLTAVTTYNFDSLGRPATLPMTVQVRAGATGPVLTVSVVASGRVSIT